MAVYFVSGIDTDSGKSVATGVIARTLLNRGVKVITQKFVQTGCECVSEDILTHRNIMGIALQDVDLYETTCPYLFSYPASPHLAAELEGKTIDAEVIHAATQELERKYDLVLLEGAGGLYVPVTRDMLTIDYIRKHNYPLIFVTSSRLGSINHTLMSLELCRVKGVEVKYVVYNEFPALSEPIARDTFALIKAYTEATFPECRLLTLPVVRGEAYPSLSVDFR